MEQHVAQANAEIERKNAIIAKLNGEIDDLRKQIVNLEALVAQLRNSEK